MRTDEERILLMNKRAGELKKQIGRMYTRLWGIASAALFLCLTVITVTFSGRGHGIDVDSAAGSSLLMENAGGYVLFAVAAFMFGVLLTAFLIRRRQKEREKLEDPGFASGESGEPNE